jgi:hypothetical protein
VAGLAAYLIYQFVGGSGRVYGLIVAGFAAIGIFAAVMIADVCFTLVAPVAMMENLTGFRAVRRSYQLIKRSLATTIGSVFIMFIIPAMVSGAISFVITTTAKAWTNTPGEVQVTKEAAPDPNEAKVVKPEQGGISFSIGNNQRLSVTDKKGDQEDMRTRLVTTVTESLQKIFWLPMHIFLSAFTAIVISLLFLKSRQAGGEPMHELLAGFRDSERPKKKWQQRVEKRLIQSGRITSKTTRE